MNSFDQFPEHSPSLRVSIEERLSACQLLINGGRLDSGRALDLSAEIEMDVTMLQQFSVIDDDLYLRITSIKQQLEGIALSAVTIEK